VQQWRFAPHIVGGEPTAFVVPVTFRLSWPAPQRANVAIELGGR
jgi:hypothetical protein